MLTGQFHLPIFYDLAATVIFAATGAITAARKRYDFIGVLVLSLSAGLGGALLRDGVFLNTGPLAILQDGRYLLAVLGGAAIGMFFARYLQRLSLAISVIDGLGLGIYAVVGAQKSLQAGLGILAATLVGTVNAVGGGLVRDVLVREEPMLFRPSEFYAIASIIGAWLFAVFASKLHVDAQEAAWGSIAITFGVRMLSLRLGWRTTPVEYTQDSEEKKP
ncbi:MAG: TRIC cation channel family protein [Deltaproteobacteria bacterium]|nr:TRIC cation channel family protein [Deltaproteobacteria bacterium]